VELSARQQEVLEQIVRRQRSPQRLVRRASILLHAAQGASNQQIADHLHITLYTVRTWRRRWQEARPRLLPLESDTEDDRLLSTQIEAVLSDVPRPGGPTQFTPEQLIDLIAVACEDPQDSGRPISHWTPRELAEEVIQRGIVASISRRQVGRFLKGSGFEAAPESLLAASPLR
jgi:putative transposase